MKLFIYAVIDMIQNKAEGLIWWRDAEGMASYHRYW